jgi:hypothetical protein
VPGAWRRQPAATQDRDAKLGPGDTLTLAVALDAGR